MKKIILALAFCLLTSPAMHCLGQEPPQDTAVQSSLDAAPEVVTVTVQEVKFPSGPAIDAQLYDLLAATKEALRSKNHEEVRSRLKELAGRCSDYGITSYEGLSAALIKEGQRQIDENDLAGALLLFDYATIISPDYPPSYFAKGWGLLKQKDLKVLMAFDAFIDGIKRSTKDFWWSYNYLGNKATSLLFALAALFSLFGLFICMRYTPLFAHDLAEKFDRLEHEPVIKYLLLPAVFTLILLLMGYWWAVTIALLSLWMYLNKREKILSVLFFLLLVFMPSIMTKYANFVQGGGNKTLWVMDEVNKGRIEPGAESYLRSVVEADSTNNLAKMSLAQICVKQRRYSEGAVIYEQLVSIDPDSSIYRNNLANIYFLMKNYDRAIQEYRAAIKYGPNKPLPHFNLSQIYGEKLMFTERADEDRLASRLDTDLVTSLRAREGAKPRRMVFDYPVPIDNLWKMAFSTSPESRLLADSLWSTTIRIMPLEGASYAGIGFIVLVLAMNSVRRRRSFSHFCEKCGKVSCKKCQKPVYSKDLCAQCHQIFIKLEGVEAKDRLKKTLEIKDKQIKEGMLFRISSLLLPGSGHYLMGRPLRGFIFSGIFIFLVKDLFFGRFLDSPYSFSLNVIGPDTLLLGMILVASYLITQLDIYRITK